MITINPKEIPTSKFHAYLLGAVAPRPIAFASTIDKNGNINLAPFSFFNAFGTHPPTLIFAPNRRVKDGTNKHTLENVKEVPEVVINMVSFSMVQQTSLASSDYAKGVNEFDKAGFTAIPSEKVKPPRVKESPVQFECKVVNVIEMGHQGGAPNLIICEVLLMHIYENVLDPDGRINPHKIDLVARMGSDLYCRASGAAVFEVEKPKKLGLGIDAIPEKIRMSNVLTGNDLGKLGNVESLPSNDEITVTKNLTPIQELFTRFQFDNDSLENHLQQYAKKLLNEEKVMEAWRVLLCNI